VSKEDSARKVHRHSNSLDINAEDAASGQKDRRSFFVIIIFLGCFSLVALYGAVYLNAAIQNLFQSAINEGLNWESTRQKLTQLSVLAGRVNAPINDVFISRQVDTEREFMRKNYVSVLEILNQLNGQLESRNEETGEQILVYLDDVNANLYSMMTEAEFVFTYLQGSQIDLATERMAFADQLFREASALLGSADEVVQRVSLQRFNQDANSVQKLYALGKVIIAGLTFCFIIFVAVGIRMVRTLNRNQNTLAYSRVLLSKTLNSVADAVIGCDQYGRISEWNTQAARLFGANLGGRMSLVEIVPGLAAFMNPNSSTLRIEDEMHIDHLKAFGDVDQLQEEPSIDIDINVARIETLDQGNTKAKRTYVLTIRDMREVRKNAAIIARSQAKLRLQLFQNDLIRQKLADQAVVLKEAKSKAEASTQAKSRFLAIMSHELRTPMNAILGFSRILQRGDLTQSQEEALRRIIDASNHLLGIINDILDMSKIESGGLVLEQRPVEFVEELKSVVQTFSALRQKNNIGFFAYVDVNTPTRLVADTTRLRQIITNLLGNAFQFTETGAVCLRIFPVPRVEYTGDKDGSLHLLRFEVQDTGIGMSQEQQTRVFDPFTQADTSITRKYGGTGLGLTITRQIVQSFGGKIELDSTVGVGSCFSFTLPFTRDVDEVPYQPVDFKQQCPIQVAVISQDDRFIDWAHYCLSGTHVTCVVFSDVDQTFIDWWQGVLLEEGLPRVLVDGFLSRFAGQQLIAASEQCNAILLTCFYLVNIGAESRFEAEQVYGRTLYMPLFPMTLVDELWGSQQDTEYTPNLAVDLKAYTVPKLTGKQILVVDDILSNRQYLHELLKVTACGVTLVESGQEAIQLCHVRVFDLVLMDIHMPVMNGFDASIAIKAIRYASKTHIVGLTADAVNDVLENCLEHGMTTCLAKPFSAGDLYSTLGFLFNKTSDGNKIIDVNSVENLMFDTVKIDVQGALERISQKTNLYQRLINAFLDRTVDLDKQLQALLDTPPNSETAQFLASVRGTALSVGAVELGETLSNFESAMLSGHEVKLAFIECENVLQKTRSAMKVIDKKIGE